jgi:peptide/nickel transport system substrate-binding protein
MKPDGIKHKKLFTDKKVRRAMALLCPLDEMNKVLNNNRNKRITGPVSPLKKEYNSDLKLIPFDVEQAKKLLDETGWKDTDGDNIRDKVIDGQKVQFEFDLNFPNTQIEWKDAATMIADAMNKAGIKVNLNPLDSKTHHNKNATHDFDMIMGAWGLNFAPEDYTQIWHSSSWSSNGDNYEGFGTPESDALIDSIKYEVDPAKYIPMVKRLQTIIYDEQPYIFTFSYMKRVVCHKRFGNCEMFFERPAILLNTLKLLASEDKSAKK